MQYHVRVAQALPAHIFSVYFCPQVAVAPVPVMLAPKQQVQVAVQVHAMAPFNGAPELLLDYMMGNVVVHQVSYVV